MSPRSKSEKTGPVAASDEPQDRSVARPEPPHESLEGIHGTIAVPPAQAGFWRQWRAFVGPAILISVGYMDPGNWGTDLAGGAQYKFGLLWVVGLASLMAIFMQVISSRLGVVAGKDLAQCCRDWYPSWTRWPNWLFCELAIGACDLAEVLGSAVALNLMFHIPLLWAVIITGLDVLLLLGLQGFGIRTIEAIVLVLVGTIGVCYFIELFVLPGTQPAFLEMGQAIISPGFRHPGMIYVAIGMIGATVMPHNLYLHSALVQSRRLQQDDASIRSAIRFNAIDSTVALTIAFFVNAAILVLAAMVFYNKTSVTVAGGEIVKFSPDSDWIRIAYLTLAPLLGTTAASTLFVVALLASGQSSTITGTLAGQVVMEGFMHWRLKPWLRRLITRMLAILPAVLISIWPETPVF
jgi:manganese transport protein